MESQIWTYSIMPKINLFYIIEINPRFWATLTAALMAGINYPHLLILMTLKKKLEYRTINRIPYVNLLGLKLLIKKDKSYLFKPGFIWKNTPLKYRLDDPLPVLYRLFSKIKEKVIKKFS
jgi:D-aspartate ligase